VFTYRKFDVNVVRALKVGQLAWPDWGEARRVFTLESDLIDRIEKATDIDAESESIEDYLYRRAENLHGLDLGIASTVICLSAARCVPFTSCNGGAFGGRHQEAYPLAAFFARSRTTEQILVSAGEADIGLENGPGGAFAASILERRRLLGGRRA
jgi:hypothetical protein